MAAVSDRHLPRRFKEDVRKKVDEQILMDYNPEQYEVDTIVGAGSMTL